MRAPQNVMPSSTDTVLIGPRIVTRKGKDNSAVKAARNWAVPSRRQSRPERSSLPVLLATAAPRAWPARNAVSISANA